MFRRNYSKWRRSVDAISEGRAPIRRNPSWGRVGSDCPLWGSSVTLSPNRTYEFPGIRLSLYVSSEDSLYQEAYQHGVSDDTAYRGSAFSCVALPSVVAIAPSHELHP